MLRQIQHNEAIFLFFSMNSNSGPGVAIKKVIK